jgi:hypothetical protein
MAHGEALAIRLQIFVLCSEESHVSDIRTVEVSDMWSCDQQNFTLDYEWKDMCVCIRVYIYIYIHI